MTFKDCCTDKIYTVGQGSQRGSELECLRTKETRGLNLKGVGSLIFGEMSESHPPTIDTDETAVDINKRPTTIDTDDIAVNIDQRRRDNASSTWEKPLLKAPMRQTLCCTNTSTTPRSSHDKQPQCRKRIAAIPRAHPKSRTESDDIPGTLSLSNEALMIGYLDIHDVVADWRLQASELEDLPRVLSSNLRQFIATASDFSPQLEKCAYKICYKQDAINYAFHNFVTFWGRATTMSTYQYISIPGIACPWWVVLGHLNYNMNVTFLPQPRLFLSRTTSMKTLDVLSINFVFHPQHC